MRVIACLNSTNQAFSATFSTLALLFPRLHPFQKPLIAIRMSCVSVCPWSCTQGVARRVEKECGACYYSEFPPNLPSSPTRVSSSSTSQSTKIDFVWLFGRNHLDWDSDLCLHQHSQHFQQLDRANSNYWNCTVLELLNVCGWSEFTRQPLLSCRMPLFLRVGRLLDLWAALQLAIVWEQLQKFIATPF